MKIRRLEIQGFKSFADRTILKFGDGITGVVGPNGCGKSNIVDAIRWVMGEQSAKHLRGMGMQDVIFAGCEARGPAGMAEVSITFKNDGALVPPEYRHMSEIQVTRRLFRDGTSEYAINEVRCRLRDILDLFMGTGIGRNAYAIIEQGRIGMIVTARPEERRALIEDAAGVSRYKARRKTAERRIAATEQNLLRVTDLVKELEGRLESLEAQAEKAERYKALKAQLKDLDLHAAAHKRLELDARELFAQRRADALGARVEAERTGVEADEAAIEAELEALAERESALREAEGAAHETQRALDLARQNVEFLLREDAKHEERIAEAEAERGELHEEKRRLEAEREEVEALESSLGAGASQEARTLEAREIALEALDERIAEARRHLEAEKASMVESLTSVAQRKNALENVERRREDLDARALTADENARAARHRAAETKTRVEKLEGELAQSRQLKLELEEEQAAEEKNLEDLRAHAAELEAQLGESREKLLDRRSRLRSLEQIRSNYEGCSDAVRAVMTREQEGLHGLVADVIAADARYETAVEAVLGERLQSVVVAEQQDGFEAVRFLREENKGRSTFVPLDLRLDHAPWAPRALPSERISTTPPRGQPAEIPVASTVPSGAPVAGSGLLSSSSSRPAGEDGASARADAPSLGPGPAPEAGVEVPTALPEPVGDAEVSGSADLPIPNDALSDDGDWLEEEDSHWPDLQAAGVCGKMTDLVPAKPGYEPVAKALFGDVVVVESLEKAHELWVSNGHRKTLVTLDGEVLDPMGLFTGGSSAGVSEGLLGQKREMEALRAEVTQLDARVKAAEEKKKEARAKIEKLEARVKTLSTEGQQGALSIVSFERDLASLRDRIAAEDETAARAEEEAGRLRAELRALDEEKRATEGALTELESGHADAEHRVGDASDALETLEQQARELKDEITALKVDVAANREKRDSSRKNLTRIVGRLDDIEARIDKLDALMERSRGERDAGAERAQAERARIEELEAAVAAATAEVEAQRTALDADRTRVKGQEQEVRERRAELERIRGELSETEMSRRELQIARENLQGQIRERYQVDLESILTEYHVLPPQSEAHVKLTKKLRRQLAEIGAINLTAIEEFREVKARHDHLASQKRDLEQAIAALRAAIDKINQTSRERYLEAFRLVNEKFQQVFPKVFAGGRCALVLTDEDDPLESGIEIMAQPPGKKLQSVNLLSGGEKALTAVSLIFGIFLIKPTPFCLLDEVDAPLDEANVGRYNEMLREMAPISQFVLITHNKKTMELPDRLYGVTMEVPGISKIVPVDVVTGEPETPRLEAV
jgi:chromosome segregation protein